MKEIRLELVYLYIILGFNTSKPEVAVTNVPSSSGNQPVIAKPTFIPGSTTLRDYASGVPDDVYYYPNPEVPLSDLPENFVPLWQPGTPLEVSVYISENEYFMDYQKQADYKTGDIHYSQAFDGRETYIEIPATKVTITIGYILCILPNHLIRQSNTMALSMLTSLSHKMKCQLIPAMMPSTLIRLYITDMVIIDSN